jgi:hypothetical protein
LFSTAEFYENIATIKVSKLFAPTLVDFVSKVPFLINLFL